MSRLYKVKLVDWTRPDIEDNATYIVFKFHLTQESLSCFFYSGLTLNLWDLFPTAGSFKLDPRFLWASLALELSAMQEKASICTNQHSSH